MKLKSLTYTSLARLDLTVDDLDSIHQSAMHLNALDGITGLLIFNGTHFLQVVEGAGEAIDDLVERLRRDPRHHGVEIRDQRMVEQRSFPDWSMELVRVKARYYEAKDAIEQVLPQGLADETRSLILTMTERISTTAELD